MLIYCGGSVNKWFVYSLQSEIGFGKMESYTKLDKLGEVSLAAKLSSCNNVWGVTSICYLFVFEIFMYIVVVLKVVSHHLCIYLLKI